MRGAARLVPPPSARSAPWPCSMAPSEADSYAFSTTTPPSGISSALAGGSSGGEVLPRRLHVGEGDLHPFVSPRAAILRQAFACAKWGDLAVRALAHGVLTPVVLRGLVPPHGAQALSHRVPPHTNRIARQSWGTELRYGPTRCSGHIRHPALLTRRPRFCIDGPGVEVRSCGRGGMCLSTTARTTDDALMVLSL